MLADRVRMRSIGSIELGPGPPELIAGTMEEGFFGEVSTSELITGTVLASEVGITAGSVNVSSLRWLKFAYMNRIQFVSKIPIRYNLSWNQINQADCVYGDKIIEIQGLNYKVRLLKGFNEVIDPKYVGTATQGVANHYSEWNRLLLQVHVHAINKNWTSPNNVESDLGILKHNLGSGSQGMYTDTNLGFSSAVNRGHNSWCQNTGYASTVRLGRGGVSASDAMHNAGGYVYNSMGWRPVLEIVT